MGSKTPGIDLYVEHWAERWASSQLNNLHKQHILYTLQREEGIRQVMRCMGLGWEDAQRLYETITPEILVEVCRAQEHRHG